MCRLVLNASPLTASSLRNVILLNLTIIVNCQMNMVTWIRNCSTLSIHILLLFLLGHLFKKPTDPSFQIGLGWNLARIDWGISHKMSQFQDGGHNVISHRKVLPSGQCKSSVRQAPAAHMHQRHGLPISNLPHWGHWLGCMYYSSWCIVYSYAFLHMDSWHMHEYGLVTYARVGWLLVLWYKTM